MKTHLLCYLALMVLGGMLSTLSQAADPPGWKTSATIKVPSIPTSVLLTDDHQAVTSPFRSVHLTIWRTSKLKNENPPKKDPK